MENFGTDDEDTYNVAVAVSESRNCKSVVKWALGKFVPEGVNCFRLLHVCPTFLTTARDDEALARRKNMELKINMMLLPYKQICSGRQVDVEYVIIEADNIALAISEQVSKLRINKLVIGSTSGGAFSRRFKSGKVYKILECLPSFCTVFEISNGKLLYTHKPAPRTGEMLRDDATRSSTSSNGLSSHESNDHLDFNEADSSTFTRFYSPNLQIQRDQALRAVNQSIIGARMSSDGIIHSRSLSMNFEDDAASSSSGSAEIQSGRSGESSYRSTRTDYQLWNSELTSTADNLPNNINSENQIDYNLELERLRIELKNLQGMIEKTKTETIGTSQKVHELTALHDEDESKLNELLHRELKARKLAWQESKAREAAEKEAKFVRDCAERETAQRQAAEDSASREAQEKERLEKALITCEPQLKTFEWEEIVAATKSFSESLQIGSGANGVVYKGNLRHTTVAIKVLHSNEDHQTKHFKQELEVLARIRHPHLLLLLGACPEHGCLIYQYMEHGSLADRLECKNNAPPLQWFHRFRIAWEVASALLFLHNTKPKPIIHRDVKPANILLDHNLVSKIGDVGLSTLLPAGGSPFYTMAKQTAPVGTFCYIDPEYQRTGVVSPQSDTYGLGIVILQLVTGKPPMGLAYFVETEMEKGSLQNIYDSKAGEWPIEETHELVVLALSCAELKRSDRPNLESKVLPELERLKKIGDDARSSRHASSAPSHFLCPIFQKLMEDPCVAADGYTYDRKAIEMWLQRTDRSFMTNMPLPNKNLIPNHSLRSALVDWLSQSH